MAAETPALDAWLYGRLSGDDPLASAMEVLAGTVYDPGSPPSRDWHTAWYPTVAPESAPRVYGLWGWTATPDLLAMGGLRIAVVPRLTVVVAAASADLGALEAVADRLDALLHGASGTGTGIAIDSIIRISEQSRLEDFQGVRWLTLGGLYEVRARSTL